MITRQSELKVAKPDRVDQAVEMVLKHVHQQRRTRLDNLHSCGRSSNRTKLRCPKPI